MICLGYFFVSISIQAANITSIVYFPVHYLGFVSQGGFQCGSILGSILSRPGISRFGLVRPLAVSALLGGLYPILMPITSQFEDWALVLVVLSFSFLSGIGASFYSIVQVRPLLKMQQLAKRSPCIGIHLCFLVLSGIAAGLLLCLPDSVQSQIESWQVSLAAGLLALVSIIVNLLIKEKEEEETRLNKNKGATLHYLSFVFGLVAIGVGGI